MNNRHKLTPFENSIKARVSALGVHKVLVALSGGADSIATTFALKRIGLEIKALHCNFNLRGEESLRDKKFVENFCKEHDIPLEIKEFDTIRYIQSNKGVSTEMACRELRYSWFQECLVEQGFERIVTGHNADDNIETFFLNLFRGSGSKGLKGMVSDNGTIWRPLLGCHRSEIELYLKDNNLSYVIDSSNLSNAYRRNLLRNTIIPLIKHEWKGFQVAMDKTIQNLTAEYSVIEEYLKNLLPVDGSPLLINEVLNSPAPLLILQRFIDPFGPHPATAKEIYNAIKANKPHIRRWRLKKGIIFLRNGKLYSELYPDREFLG